MVEFPGPLGSRQDGLEPSDSRTYKQKEGEGEKEEENSRNNYQTTKFQEEENTNDRNTFQNQESRILTVISLVCTI